MLTVSVLTLCIARDRISIGYPYNANKIFWNNVRKTTTLLPSNRRRCVALYACLSFCSCFSIFLFASLRISSSSSVFPARKQPIPPATSATPLLRRVRTSNEPRIHWLNRAECCKHIGLQAGCIATSARSMSAAHTNRSQRSICQLRCVAWRDSLRSNHDQLISKKTTVIGRRTVQERASPSHYHERRPRHRSSSSSSRLHGRTRPRAGHCRTGWHPAVSQV